MSAESDILTSTILTYSIGSGKSGNVTLTSTQGGIDTTNGSSDVTNREILTIGFGGSAGAVSLKADKFIRSGNILANSSAQSVVGNGGQVSLVSTSGNIEAGSITTSSQNGAGGNIKVEAGGDILTGAIASNTVAGSGKGGNIILDGKNLTAESLRADSVGADGGQIRLTADKFIQITGSTSVNGKDYSIFTDSKDAAPSSNDTGARSAPILIRHSQKVRDESLTPFIVGDSSKNGTARSISDGIVDFWVSSGNTRKVYDFDFQFNDIYIKRPFALLADISNILGIPGVPILKKDSDIINNILKFSPYIPALDIQSISNSVVSLLSRISKQELVNLGLGIQKADLDKYYSYLITAMAMSGINSVDNQAHFLTQVIHESDRFAQTSEGGGASASYAPYYGRGLIQITYPETYRGFGESLFLGDTFVKDPDLVSSKPIFAVLASTWYWTSDFEKNKIRGKNWRNSQTNSLLSSFKEIAEDISFSNNVVTDTDGNESDRVERITSILNGGYNALSDRKLVFSKVIQALGN